MRKALTLLVLAAPALSACNTYDPLLAGGKWNPMHVNRADLTMMAANPADLVHGSGQPGVEGQLATAPIDRLMAGKVKKLPEAGLSEIHTQSQGGGGE